MASSYTSNSGIEKPAEGDQTGEWGDTVNTNMDIIDRSINGVGAITLSGTTHTLTTTDGTLSDGMYKVLVLGGSPSGTNTITISPNDQDKVYIVVNGSGQTATFTQGSGGNVSVLNGDSKIIYADGAGSGAAIVDVTADLSFSSVNIDGGTIDGTVIGGASAAAGTFTTVTASGEIDGASLDISGNADIDGTLETDALSIASTTVTSTAAELNLVDGSSAGSIVNSKAVIYSSAGVVNATDMAVTGSGNRSITITSTDAIASMEIGAAASNAAFIDLKTPTSDDFDVRLSSESGGSGGFLQVASGNLTLSGSGKTSAVFDGDGAVSLYHNNSVKIATASGGITVTGEVAATSLDISGDVDVDGTLETDALSIASTAVTATAAELNYLDITTLGTTQASKAVTTDSNGDVVFPDGDKINLGTGSDLVLQHDSANSYIQNNTGSLNIQGKSGENGIVLVPDGAVTLYYDNAAKLATASGGVAITGDATFADSGKAIFGAGSDFQIFHDGSNTYLTESGDATGQVYLRANSIELLNNSNETYAKFLTDGAVELYHNNAKKLETHASGVLMNTTSEVQFYTTAYGIRASTGLEIKTGDFTRFLKGTTEYMRILADGKVGIGTSTPENPLTIQDIGGSTFNRDFAIRNGDATNYHRLVLGYNAASAASGVPTNAQFILAEKGGGYGTSAGLVVGNSDNAPLMFTTNATERVRIAADGNVGIGTTSTGDNKLTVEGGVAATNGSSLALKSGSGANSRVADLAFYGTFVTPDTDTGQRRTADITSGFSTANWGNEYLAFGVGTGGGNDSAAVTTERVRIAGNGNVGIGTSSPAAPLDVVATSVSALSSSQRGRSSDNLSIAAFFSNDGATRYSQIRSASDRLNISAITAIPLVFDTNGSERMRIDSSGNLLVGTTNTSLGIGNTNTGFQVENNGTFLASRADNVAGSLNRNNDGTILTLRRSGNEVGTIGVTSSSTSYNTSSDYRLKENVDYSWDATTRLKQLKPARFNFKVNADSEIVDGFLAHEVSSIVPEAITGTKDEVDDDGNPVYQSIDQSKLVPLLVKTIQELEARITALEAG